jgi:hypothetical protein
LIINSTTVHVIANAPEEIDYTSYGIDHAWLSIIQVLLRLKKLWVDI